MKQKHYFRPISYNKLNEDKTPNEDFEKCVLCGKPFEDKKHITNDE